MNRKIILQERKKIKENKLLSKLYVLTGANQFNRQYLLYIAYRRIRGKREQLQLKIKIEIKIASNGFNGFAIISF